MYSLSVTTTQIERIEKQSGLKLYRYSPSDSRAVSDHLKQAIGEDGKPTRQLRQEEHAFIRNERILSQLDATYAFRYFAQISDGGGLFYLDHLWDSQKLLLARLGALEERNVAQAQRKEACDGMLIADHKGGRQLGHTAISRALIWHRTLFYPHTRTASVSVDEPGITGVFSKDELLYENLPWWLKPELRYKSKDAHFKFEPLGSSVTYYQAQQRSGVGTGIGTGQTFDVSHMTEVAMYAYPQMLEKDFFPTIPQNPYSLCILETTAFYRGGWWFEFSEAVRHGRKPRWSYLFIPFYAEPSKYRRQPPEGWQPNGHTLAMASTVERTSPEFMNGQTIHLSREQLYWWESSYAEAQESNSLNSWLSNYSVTPEQSFQHAGQSAFPLQLLDELRMRASNGIAYEVEVA